MKKEKVKKVIWRLRKFFDTNTMVYLHLLFIASLVVLILNLVTLILLDAVNYYILAAFPVYLILSLAKKWWKRKKVRKMINMARQINDSFEMEVDLAEMDARHSTADILAQLTMEGVSLPSDKIKSLLYHMIKNAYLAGQRRQTKMFHYWINRGITHERLKSYLVSDLNKLVGTPSYIQQVGEYTKQLVEAMEQIVTKKE